MANTGVGAPTQARLVVRVLVARVDIQGMLTGAVIVAMLATQQPYDQNRQCRALAYACSLSFFVATSTGCHFQRSLVNVLLSWVALLVIKCRFVVSSINLSREDVAGVSQYDRKRTDRSGDFCVPLRIK